MSYYDRMEDYNYHMDPRTNARSGYENYDKDRCRIGFYMEDEDGNDVFFSLPAKLEVCGLCGGKGSYVSPGIDAGGLTQENFYDDPEFAEDYWSGAYDQGCDACHGNNVVPEVNENVLTENEQKLYEVYLRKQEDDAHYDYVCRAERAMGA